jgi:calcium/calmodulin-dependent protein kinase I
MRETMSIKKSLRDISEFYKLDSKVLGTGTFGVVKLGYSLATGEKIAAKIIKRSGLAPYEEEMIRQEIKIMKSLNHPNIVRCYDYFETDETFYIILELLPGGELFDRIMQHSYTELRARDTIKSVLEGIKYCHDRNIVHRDMKPENLLLSAFEDDAAIKITDFGFATQAQVSVNKKIELKGKCGTADYVAPEILNSKSYDLAVDMWSIGVITYVLLSGTLPFFAEAEDDVFEKIKAGIYGFPVELWDHISVEAKDFISHLIEYEPKKRYTCDEALGHKWIISGPSELPLDAPLLDHAEVFRRTSVMQSDEQYRYKLARQFQVLVKAVVAVTKLQQAQGSRTVSRENSFLEEISNGQKEAVTSN